MIISIDSASGSLEFEIKSTVSVWEFSSFSVESCTLTVFAWESSSSSVDSCTSRLTSFVSGASLDVCLNKREGKLSRLQIKKISNIC